MSTIRCIYEEEPRFPAIDQHPDAVRYRVGGFWVDAVGGKPTATEVLAVMDPPAPLPPRDLVAELDALTAVLIEKAVLVKGEIDAKTEKILKPNF